MCCPVSCFTIHVSNQLFVTVWRFLTDFTQYLDYLFTGRSVSLTHLCRFSLVLLQIHNIQLKHVSSQKCTIFTVFHIPLILQNFEPSQHTKPTKRISVFSFSFRFEHGLLWTDVAHIDLHLSSCLFLPLQEKLWESECFEKILKIR